MKFLSFVMVFNWHQEIIFFVILHLWHAKSLAQLAEIIL